MDTTQQTISINLNQSFEWMARTILQEWIQDEPTSDQVQGLAEIAQSLVRELLIGIEQVFMRTGLSQSPSEQLRKAVVIEAWTIVFEEFAGRKVDIIERRFGHA